jgi:hypothetical protein
MWAVAVSEDNEEEVDLALIDAAKRGNVSAARVVLSKVKRKPKPKRSIATELAAEPEWKGESADEPDEERPRGSAPRGAPRGGRTQRVKA